MRQRLWPVVACADPLQKGRQGLRSHHSADTPKPRHLSVYPGSGALSVQWLVCSSLVSCSTAVRTTVDLLAVLFFSCLWTDCSVWGGGGTRGHPARLHPCLSGFGKTTNSRLVLPDTYSLTGVSKKKATQRRRE